MSNQFSFGKPVYPEQFVGREDEINKLSGNILQGTSSVIVGDPRIGKTSLLNYVQAKETRELLYGSMSNNLHFVYLDAQTFDREKFAPSQFWQIATEDLYEKLLKSCSDSSSTQACTRCLEDKFDRTSVIRGFFECLHEENLRLVILVDEFDVVLGHPQLNTPAFLGCLRSFSSSFQSLCLVLATRNSLTALNVATQEVSNKLFQGSPYFNTYRAISLGPFLDRDSATLLGRSEEFTAMDRRCLLNLTGGHPYFLQVASHTLQVAYRKFPQDPYRRWRYVNDELYAETERTLENLWSLWSPKTKIAFMGIGLPQITQSSPKFKQRDLSSIFPPLKKELEELTERGWIVKDPQNDTWRVRAEATLFWLSNQIAREVYDDVSAQEWLQKRQLDDFNLLTLTEREKWNKTLSAISELFKDGAKTLIEATAKGFAEAMIKQP